MRTRRRGPRRATAFGLTVACSLVLIAGSAPIVAQTTVSGTLRTPSSNAVEALVYLVPEDGIVGPVVDGTGMIDQSGLRYLPTVRPVLPGTAVEFRNSDPILHNVFSPAGPGAGFDLGTYPERESRSHTFDELGTHIILCHVHPEMYAYVVVVPSSYFSLADEDGRFSISEVPRGRYEVRVWQRRLLDYEGVVSVGTEPASITIDLTSER